MYFNPRSPCGERRQKHTKDTAVYIMNTHYKTNAVKLMRFSLEGKRKMVRKLRPIFLPFSFHSSANLSGEACLLPIRTQTNRHVFHGITAHRAKTRLCDASRRGCPFRSGFTRFRSGGSRWKGLASKSEGSHRNTPGKAATLREGSVNIPCLSKKYTKDFEMLP